MAVTLNLTETAIFTALRTFLLNPLPVGTPVIRGQVNRVPEPVAENYVIMNPLLRARQETNTETWDQTATAPTTWTALNPIQVSVSCDFHGPLGADFAWIIVTLARSPYGCEVMRLANALIQPLYAEDPRQLPFINGEDQYEDRWSVDLVLQANATVTTPMEFMNAIDIVLINVDATYPP